MTTITPLLEEMKNIERIREDIDLPMSNLIMWDDGTILSRAYGEFKPSDVTIAKLCNMYKLSHPHIKTLAQEQRYDLIADQFNHFLDNDNRTMKLRLIGNRIKGIVPRDYKKYDDYDMFSQVDNYLKERQVDHSVEVVNRDDEYTRLRFTFDDTATNMGIAVENGTENDMVKGGFEITNSEIGLNGMSVNSLVYRQVCSNGMMGLTGDDENREIFYKRGRDFNPFSRTNLLQNAMSNAISRSAESIQLFRKTKDITVDDPEQEIGRLGRKYKLSGINVDNIQDKFQIEPQNNYYGVLNAITRAGKSYKKDYRNRSKLELVANDVLSKVVKV